MKHLGLIMIIVLSFGGCGKLIGIDEYTKQKMVSIQNPAVMATRTRMVTST